MPFLNRRVSRTFRPIGRLTLSNSVRPFPQHLVLMDQPGLSELGDQGADGDPDAALSYGAAAP